VEEYEAEEGGRLKSIAGKAQPVYPVTCLGAYLIGKNKQTPKKSPFLYFYNATLMLYSYFFTLIEYREKQAL
jgi:hypothetical protein